MKKTTTLLVALIGGVISFTSSARAVPLNTSFAGNAFVDTPLPGTTSAGQPELAGIVLQDESQPFSLAAGSITGWVQNRVVRETLSGTLDFYWRVSVDPTSTGGGISAFRLGEFGFSNLTNGDWRMDGVGSAAPEIARLFNPDPPGNRPDGAVNFLFDPNVQPSDPFDPTGGSRFFFLHTDATDYVKTASYDLVGPNNQISTLFDTFRPVPEPSTILLATFGIIVLGASAARRARRS